jgi:dUTP pyrophosphatase
MTYDENYCIRGFEPTRFERVKAYPDAILPERATTNSVGYDMYCACDTEVLPHEIALIPTGVKCYLNGIMKAWLMIALRSSTPKKKGLMLANGIGVIDADYVDNP